jgi:hypothetical protein
MASDWNRLLERIIDTGALTVAEYRLLIVIMRSTLGYRQRSAALGERFLRDRSGLHGRSFERARQGLMDAGLLTYESGKGGRGHRSTYKLNVEESPALTREFTGERKSRSGDAKGPLQSGHGAPERARYR